MPGRQCFHRDDRTKKNTACGKNRPVFALRLRYQRYCFRYMERFNDCSTGRRNEDCTFFRGDFCSIWARGKNALDILERDFGVKMRVRQTKTSCLMPFQCHCGRRHRVCNPMRFFHSGCVHFAPRFDKHIEAKKDTILFQRKMFRQLTTIAAILCGNLSLIGNLCCIRLRDME